MRVNMLSSRKNSKFLLMGGQSNCAGYQATGPDTNIYQPSQGRFMFDNPTAEWQQLQQNWNNGGAQSVYRGFVGCEMRLMELLHNHCGADQYMFKYSAGGTSINPVDSIEDPPRYNWGPESAQPYMYHGFVDSCRIAMRAFPAQHIRPDVLLWIQGEDDTDPVNANNYQVNFLNLIKCIKRDLNLPNLKVCQTLLADTQTAYSGTGKNIVNEAKINFSTNGNKYVNIDGADCPGGVHFSAAGQADIAERVFAVLKTML